MGEMLLRNLPDDTLKALTEKAQAAGKDRQSYVVEHLIEWASEPVVKTRYALRFYNDKTPGHGTIRRLSDDVNGVGGGAANMDEKSFKAYQKAQDLIRRNQPGDREQAIHLLKECFENVFEIPV